MRLTSQIPAQGEKPEIVAPEGLAHIFLHIFLSSFTPWRGSEWRCQFKFNTNSQRFPYFVHTGQKLMVNLFASLSHGTFLTSHIHCQLILYSLLVESIPRCYYTERSHAIWLKIRMQKILDIRWYIVNVLSWRTSERIFWRQSTAHEMSIPIFSK